MVLRRVAGATACAGWIAAGLAAWTALPEAAGAAPFDIVLDVLQTPSASQAAALAEAEAFWEDRILGYRGGTRIDELVIEVTAVEEDGEGGTLASADWLEATEGAGFVLPTYGFIDFDLADLAPLEEADELVDTIVHEIAHVMGFGSLWPQNGLYVEGSGAYTGGSALAVYRREFDPGASFIPVELGEGEGIDDVHWDEDWAGGRSELMTGFVDEDEFLSDTSLASFRDLGYRTASLPAPVPLPAALWLGLAGLGALAAARRRG